MSTKVRGRRNSGIEFASKQIPSDEFDPSGSLKQTGNISVEENGSLIDRKRQSIGEQENCPASQNSKGQTEVPAISSAVEHERTFSQSMKQSLPQRGRARNVSNSETKPRDKPRLFSSWQDRV